MSEKRYFKEESKKQWYNPAGTICNDDLNVGCLQRIADSLEKMEQPFANLLAERERYQKSYHNQLEHNRFLERRIAALQGVITKLKKQKP